jgi:hypothetical protein
MVYVDDDVNGDVCSSRVGREKNARCHEDIHQIVLRRRGGGGCLRISQMVASIAEEIGDVRVDIMVTTLMMKNRSRSSGRRCVVAVVFALLIFFLFWRQRKSNRPRPVRFYDEPTTKQIEKERRPCLLKMKIRTRHHGNQYVSDKVPSLAFLFRNTFKNCDLLLPILPLGMRIFGQTNTNYDVHTDSRCADNIRGNLWHRFEIIY